MAAEEEELAPEGLADSEDRLGFDAPAEASASPEEAGADEPAGAAAGGDRPASGAAAVFDESDDLFNFDELLAATDEADEIDIEDILSDIQADEPYAPESPSGQNAGDNAPENPPALRGTVGDDWPDDPDASVEREVVVSAAPLDMRSGLGVALGLFCLLNLALVGFTWKLSRDVERRVDAATGDMLRVTRSIQERTGEHVERIESVQKPVVSPRPEGTETFVRVRQDLEAGDYPEARRRLYALLAVADRLAPDTREDVVARARFLLADTVLLQAMAAGEETP